eukprot:4149374-Prymnesium_polylepis.1
MPRYERPLRAPRSGVCGREARVWARPETGWVGVMGGRLVVVWKPVFWSRRDRGGRAGYRRKGAGRRWPHGRG